MVGLVAFKFQLFFTRFTHHKAESFDASLPPDSGFKKGEFQNYARKTPQKWIWLKPK